MASASETAANLGYSMAFFNSNPELKKLLDQAVSGNWTPGQFVAKLQNTNWFKKNGEAARQIYALKTSDPATYNQRLDSAMRQVREIAYRVGAGLESGRAADLAEKALAFGWTEDQIKYAMRDFTTAGEKGLYRGGAAAVQMQLREMVSAYGYSPNAEQMGRWIKDITQGAANIEQIRQAVMQTTASKFPGLKDRIMSGETLEEIAAPYKDSYSRILEVNPKTINLRDPEITKALQSKDKDGKPTTKTVYQFEEDLRKDPRWLKTNNARDTLVGNTRKLLADFGLVN